MGIGKHRNADGTWNGFGVLSEISGLTQTDVKAIWERVKENKAKLQGCRRHRFELPARLRMGERYTCLECGGNMTLPEIGNYIREYEASGGNTDDIWPGWNG